MSNPTTNLVDRVLTLARELVLHADVCQPGPGEAVVDGYSLAQLRGALLELDWEMVVDLPPAGSDDGAFAR